jgi:branched-chain amino acid transport system substrate-binding protein
MNASDRPLRISMLCGVISIAFLLLAGVEAVMLPAQGSAAAPGSTSPEESPSSTGTVITIGVGAAISALPEIGWRQVNAVQLAVDQVNTAGGLSVGGITYTLALAVADDGCNPGQGAAAANSLINAGAVAVVGYTCSGASNGAGPIHAAAGIAMISPSSTNLNVTEQGYTTTFRVISRDDNHVIPLVNYLAGWLGLDRAAILAFQGAEWSTANVSNTFASLGGTITSLRQITDTAQFTATLNAIKAEAPEAIFYSDYDPHNAGRLSRIAAGLGMGEVVIAYNSLQEGQIILDGYAAEAGPAAEGDYIAMAYRRAEDMPGYAALNAAYQAAGFPNFGGKAQMWGAFAYDAAQIIVAAIWQAGSPDPAAIRAAIAATADYDGVVGIYQGFDVKGDVIPQWSWIARYASGRWTLVVPGKVFLPWNLKKPGQ